MDIFSMTSRDLERLEREYYDPDRVYTTYQEEDEDEDD